MTSGSTIGQREAGYALRPVGNNGTGSIGSSAMMISR